MGAGSFEYISANMPLILSGLVFTCKLFTIVVVIAYPLSCIVAILAVAGPKWLKAILKTYTWIFRGSPLLLQLFLAYFGLPYIGVVLPPNFVVISVFVLCITAYESEVIRGGIISIEIGQYEACQVLGMSYAQTMWRVVIPQTARRVLPPTCSQCIVLFKDTSLVAAIGLGDLLRSARYLVIKDLRIDAFVVVLVIYLAISSIMVMAFDKLEKRYSTFV
jgi:polar amino acid transport system permease protein